MSSQMNEQLEAIYNKIVKRNPGEAEFHQAVKEEMEKPSLLLEHVSARICKRLLDEFPLIDTVRIRLSKTNPPMGADIASCGVGMECSRE